MFLNPITYYLSRIFLCIAVLFTSITSYAQTHKVKGIVIDKSDTSKIPGAAVVLTNISDTTFRYGTSTSDSGTFEINNVLPARYKLKVTLISYISYQQVVEVTNTDLLLPPLMLSSNEKLLKQVDVVGTVARVEIKGDTIQYNADAYKTHQDATAEDLLKKMPGVTTDGNTVKVNGQEVKKILVDGKPFFSNDPSATLKNLPADIVGNVQVFDQQSDQAQFTGFRDGNEEKTINLNTKKGMNVGRFGKVYGGYGTDNKYNGGFTFNNFNGSRRISIIGMSNNINQQNFSISDIMSVMSNSGNQGGGPPMPGSGDASFFTGQQNGITKTNAIGLNYNDTWGKKIRVSGNYFFNNTDNNANSTITRNYYTSNGLQYNQTSDTRTKNTNHKVNFKFEYFIDTINKLTITPRLTLQDYKKTSSQLGRNLIGGEELISTTNSNNIANANAYNFNNDILFQHRFTKKGRTISLNINTQLNNNKGDGEYNSINTFGDSLDASQIIDQQYTTQGNSTTLGANLSYTEPLGKNSQLLFSYRPSYTQNFSNKTTNNINSDGSYTQLDTFLSNKFNNSYYIQRGGISYKLNKSKTLFSLGADVETVELKGNQTYPQNLSVQRNFLNILPTASLNYSFDKMANMNITYRASTKNPEISQLQNTIDVSNALFVKAGNPQLKQSYDNSLTIRFMKRIPEKERHLMFFIVGNHTNNYISNSTYILNKDTTVQNVFINAGRQLITPTNLNNYYNLRAFGIFGFPIKAIKSNFNFNAGYTLTNTPALINNKINYSLSNSANAGVYLSSNVSQYLDFSIAYNANYNVVTNSLQTQSNSNYFNHTATFKANYILLKRIVLSSDINQYYYKGLSASFDQTFSLWNASAGYKFLKNRSLEAKVSIYDILNQNRSVSRTITETYTEDNRTQTLNRYLMLTLTYTFKKFKNSAIGPDEMKFPKGLPPPENMPPPPR
ncbi:MAG: TonB-dependent receptor [Bacteroidota bacterium]|nr:TonB-dependent receptor [Bacteroidota bacterium]